MVIFHSFLYVYQRVAGISSDTMGCGPRYRCKTAPWPIWSHHVMVNSSREGPEVSKVDGKSWILWSPNGINLTHPGYISRVYISIQFYLLYIYNFKRRWRMRRAQKNLGALTNRWQIGFPRSQGFERQLFIYTKRVIGDGFRWVKELVSFGPWVQQIAEKLDVQILLTKATTRGFWVGKMCCKAESMQNQFRTSRKTTSRKVQRFRFEFQKVEKTKSEKVSLWISKSRKLP